jgi:pimeloyl-ACP methyl ester carboxylesterase
MSVITIDGDFVHYEVIGRGRPIILLHGWLGSWRYWIPTMQSASVSYRAYAIDLWGFGDSSKRPNRYGIDQQVELLEGFLENLGISKVGIIGHGLGAIVGSQFTSKNPSFVDRILLTAFPLKFTAINPRLRTAQMNELLDWLLGRSPAAESVRTEAFKADQNAITASLDELQGTNFYEIYSSPQTPSIIVYGQHDPVIEIPSSNTMEELPEHMHCILLDQSGHFPMLDEPRKYNRLLFDFLSLNSGESPKNLQLKEEWKRRVR